MDSKALMKIVVNIGVVVAALVVYFKWVEPRVDKVS